MHKANLWTFLKNRSNEIRSNEIRSNVIRSNEIRIRRETLYKYEPMSQDLSVSLSVTLCLSYLDALLS